METKTIDERNPLRPLGEHDISMKLITDDTLRLNEILHQMDRIPGVSSTRTLVVLKTEKETSAISF